MGKIAHDQHVPAIAANRDIVLAATVSRHGEGVGSVPHFRDIDDLIASGLEIDAVSLCTPPQVRRAIAARAIAQGWHVFLEKPPGATLAEVAQLRAAADAAGISLFASWHSRYAPGVEPARAFLAEAAIRKVTVTWREDIRVWHPGQSWILEAGGFGVFDPGINALSIVTRILPRPFFITEAELDFPANRDAPIAARIRFADDTGLGIEADFDFRQEGPQSWDIVVETDQGTLTLHDGGARLILPDGSEAAHKDALHGEYAGLYHRFAEIVRARTSDVDIAPLRHVADAFLRGRRITVEPFVE
ncbi:Gfo/Idh/MocA family oxidoreductase [Sphingomonas sp. RP10(2022)]|uniref:Gfo/Idh/MocA family oxidoreductase n=2 Tax=Sphingomonas liriopis TaxID=2949094 RepID=A0A9X2HVN9_9SPHN|nr:Gfo/Idh/MocA family oxidoreductase [Sphingomonas liriopis]